MPKYLFVPAANSGNDLTGAIMQDDGALPHTQALADGTYDAYFCEAAASTLTMNDTSGGDTTAPTLSNPTDAANGATAATGSVSTDEGNGTLYWVVTTSGTAPSVAQIVAGQDNSGTAATASGSQAVSGTGVQNITPSGLTASTAYTTHFMHRDAASNDSAVVSASGFTTAAAAGGRVVIPGGAAGAHLSGAIVPDVAAFSETYNLRFTTMPASDLYLQNHDVVGLWMGATQFTSYSDDFGFQGGSAHGMTTGTDYDLVVTVDQGTGLAVTVGGSAVHTNGGATPGATLGAGTLTIFGNGDAPAGQRLACEVSSLSVDNGVTNYLDLDGTPADWNGSTYIVDGPVVAA